MVVAADRGGGGGSKGTYYCCGMPPDAGRPCKRHGRPQSEHLEQSADMANSMSRISVIHSLESVRISVRSELQSDHVASVMLSTPLCTHKSEMDNGYALPGVIDVK